ncbi:MAG TPA: threonylcarbamoyl-AMP synthase [Candidatus Limivivens intestinipullorum]|uniref:Threonylcarbamoyl-AMP synthase n=1 Tax=Candidatus Limivivens intestinipullorum TaxID=2840858 RepID=A0A9D1JIQ2_9FIRM|nr:threonylcarbamoyl-AMP synthase [Candidatus Limivivens intestinipullorum]
MITVIENAENPGSIRRAGEILKRGGLVAFPTETVYGLGANALDAEAAARIYAAKGRPSDNPLIVHIARMEDLSAVARNISHKAVLLAERFWPGPLTMIFEKTARVPYGTTGGLDTVAVRMPKDKVALAVIEAGGGFIAAPSANTSGRPSPTTAEHVAQDMNGRIDMILDGGPAGIGLESTIVDMSGEIPTILRPGYISREMLRETVGQVEVDQALIREDSGIRPKAPGMKYRHYAPKAELKIVEGSPEAVVRAINRYIEEGEKTGQKIGVIAGEESAGLYKGGLVKTIGKRADELSIARHLYGVLREFDELRVDRIYSEAFETPQMGAAIMNRLVKAAGHQIIKV